MNNTGTDQIYYNPSNAPYSREGTITRDILYSTWLPIIQFGVLANFTNIVVFLKVGVKDNVSTLLLSLSLSDITFLILITPSVVAVFSFNFARSYPMKHDILHVLFYWPAFTAYDFSSMISVFLGVTRCACVAMPLKFKSVFTRARTVKIVLMLFLLCLSIHMPALVINRLGWVTDPQTNISSLDIVRYKREELTHVNDIINRNSLPWINFIILITCVIILRFKLVQASRVRRSHTTTSATDATKAALTSDTLSPKDIRVIQAVVLVCVIFIVFQLPFLTYSTVRFIVPEFDLYRRLHNLFVCFTTTSLTCSYLNASVNIFVYYNYKYNSKYRSTFLSMLRLNAPKTSKK